MTKVVKRALDEGLLALPGKKPKSTKGKFVPSYDPIEITDEVNEVERKRKRKGLALSAHTQK